MTVYAMVSSISDICHKMFSSKGCSENILLPALGWVFWKEDERANKAYRALNPFFSHFDWLIAGKVARLASLARSSTFQKTQSSFQGAGNRKQHLKLSQQMDEDNTKE